MYQSGMIWVGGVLAISVSLNVGLFFALRSANRRRNLPQVAVKATILGERTQAPSPDLMAAISAAVLEHLELEFNIEQAMDEPTRDWEVRSRVCKVEAIRLFYVLVGELGLNEAAKKVAHFHAPFFPKPDPYASLAN